MSPAGLQVAHAAVRVWTRVYTCCLPGELRQRRIEEIESDIWESSHDSCAEGGHAARALTRLVLGIPDDLAWRIEQEATMRMRTWILAVPTAACGMVFAAFWVAMAVLAADVPPSPESPRAIASRAAVNPPPPPPPPTAPRGPWERPPAAYSMIVYRIVDDGESPRLKKNVRTVYPPIARGARLDKGHVVVRATVSPDGRASNLQVVRSIPAFDRAVLNIVRQSQFTPTTIDGRRVATPIEVLARFRR